MEFSELKKKTVVQLRELAGEYDDITGITGMKKDELLTVLAKKLGIKKPKKKAARGKGELKKALKKLKGERDKALEKKDGDTLKKVRRQIHRHKVLLRRLAG